MRAHRRNSPRSGCPSSATRSPRLGNRRRRSSPPASSRPRAVLRRTARGTTEERSFASCPLKYPTHRSLFVHGSSLVAPLDAALERELADRIRRAALTPVSSPPGSSTQHDERQGPTPAHDRQGRGIGTAIHG